YDSIKRFASLTLRRIENQRTSVKAGPAVPQPDLDASSCKTRQPRPQQRGGLHGLGEHTTGRAHKGFNTEACAPSAHRFAIKGLKHRRQMQCTGPEPGDQRCTLFAMRDVEA